MINIFQPDVKLADLDILKEVLDSNWLGRGPMVAQFQKEFASLQNIQSDDVHTVSCATDAIFQILKVLKRKLDGGSIIVPSISFPAVGSAVIENGFDLVICDVDDATAQINISEVEKVVESRNDVAAVFLTHYGGSAVNIDEIRAILPQGVLILEDSACALGSFNHTGDAVGTRGDFSCWSFDAMKLLVCGEGSAVHINDEELMTLFKEQCYLGLPTKQKSGIDSSTANDRWWEYQMTCFGARSVFTDIQAVIGLSQIPKLKPKLDAKQRTRDMYDDVICNLKKLSLVQNVNVSESSNYFYTIKSQKRDELAHFLRKNGVYTTFRYFPLSEIDLFKDYMFGDCPNASYISNNFLNIPIHDSLQDSEVSKICELMKDFDNV